MINIIAIYLLFPIIFFSYFSFKFIYKVLSTNPKYDTTITFTVENILSGISTILEIQFSIYDNNIFSGEERILNSSTFENYYNDLSAHVIDALSPTFFKKASIYFNEATLIEIVCTM